MFGKITTAYCFVIIPFWSPSVNIVFAIIIYLEVSLQLQKKNQPV